MVAEQAPARAATLESPLMFCTSAALSSVPAAGADPLEPVPSPGIVGKVRPPVDEVGVGVELVLDPPQPAIPTIETTVLGRAESPQMIAVAMAHPRPSPNRENVWTLVQSKQ